MKKFLLVLAIFAFASSAQAAPIYANLPAAKGWDAEFDAFSIGSFALSNSFTVQNASVATGVNFVSWVYLSSISSVDWVISSGDVYNGYGTIYGSGTAAAVTPAHLFTNVHSYSIANNFFSLGSLSLGAGSYFLTLSNAITGSGTEAYWDQNDGPSTAWISQYGSMVDALGYGCVGNAPSCTGSETFEIQGHRASIPDAGSSLLLLGIGLAGLRAWRNRLG